MTKQLPHSAVSCWGTGRVGGGRSTLENSGLLNIAPPLPAPGSGQEHSPPSAPLSYPSCPSHPPPGLVQDAFSCFSSLLLHSHSTVMVQILHQSLNWSPKSSLTPAIPSILVVSLPFSNSFSGFPLGEGQKTVLRTRAKPLGMAYQALSLKLTLAPSTASFPAISLTFAPAGPSAKSDARFFLHHDNSFKAYLA